MGGRGLGEHWGRALVLGASSELHDQLIWTVRSSCVARRLGGLLLFLLPLTQSRDSMVKETEVD